MPIYEYRCADCGEVNEHLLLGKNEKPLGCPKCKSQRLEKVMSAPGAVSASSGKGKCNSCEAAPSCNMAGHMCSAGCRH